jgi:predicted AlkP superfamily phosphohydrolase/phosphomutase
MNVNRVFVLGLDGATFDLILPWADEGKLPNMKKIMTEGTHGELTSTVPAHSAPAWSSFITGKNPGKHGIFDFTEHVPGEYGIRFVNANSRRGRSLWSILSDHKKLVGIINTPMTYPPEKVNGFLISGMDTPGIDTNFAYPPSIIEEVQELVSEYVLEAGLWSYIKKGKIDLAIQKQKEVIDKRFKVATHLMHKNPWDFFMVVFTATDRVQHVFWKYMDPKHPLYDRKDAEKYGNTILEVYKKLDDIIGYLLNTLDKNTTLMIMSDHGAGLSSNKSIYLNNWLYKKGLLRYKDSGDDNSRISGNLKRLLYARLLSKAPRDFWKSLPRGTRDKIKKLFPFIFHKMASQFFFGRINMNATRAYAEESRSFIWINLKGRDPRGTVEPGKEYEELCDYIVHDLTNLRCPEDQEPVVDRVFKKDEIYHGENIYKAPDLIVTFRKEGYVPRPSYKVGRDITLRAVPREELGKSESDLQANAKHEPNGIILLRGKDITENYELKGAQIIDCTPTILYTLGLPIPEDMDGRVLTGAFRENVLKTNPVIYDRGVRAAVSQEEVVPYSDEEETRIKERLSDLGYFDSRE